MVLKRLLQIFNGFWGDHHHWMFFGCLTIAINGFTMAFWCCYHRFQWFLMVPDHWSNDAMVSMDRCGLLPQKERRSKFCNFVFFFSYCKYLQRGTHQGSVSNLIFTETFEWTLSWCRGITKLSVFFSSLKFCCPKVFVKIRIIVHKKIGLTPDHMTRNI